MTSRHFRRRRPQRSDAPTDALYAAPVRSGKTESVLGRSPGDWDGPVLVTARRDGDPPQHPGQLQLPGTGTGGDGR